MRLLLVGLLFQFSFSLAKADTIDLNEELNWEDPLLNNQVVEQMRTGSGFASKGASYRPPRFKALNFGLQIQCPECGRDPNAYPGASGGDDINKASAPKSDDEPEEPTKKRKTYGQSGQSQRPFNGMATGLNGTRVKVIDGVPYVFRPDEDTPSDSELEISKPNTLASLAPRQQISAVGLNRSNDSGGKSKSNSHRGGAASSLDGPGSGFGNYESGGRKLASMSESAAQAALNKFSKGGFHSTDGISNGDSGSLIFKNGKWIKSEKRADELKRRKNLKALNKKFQQQLRRFANRPEFGDPNTSIFKSMCQHYDNWALKNNIPNDKAPCPED